MKSAKYRTKISSKEKIKTKPKIKSPDTTNPNFRNSFFRDLFERKYKNKTFLNDKSSRNKTIIVDNNLTKVISHYNINNTNKNLSHKNYHNKTFTDSNNKFYTISSASKIRRMRPYTRNINYNTHNNSNSKKYVHINKSFIDNLSNVKPRIDTSYKKAYFNFSRIDGSTPRIYRNNRTHKARPVRLRYKEYPNYTMNLYCVLKQVNDFNNGIYGNQIDNKSIISSPRRITNENEDTSIIDEIKDIQDPINNDFSKNINSRNNNYYKRFSNSISDLSDKNLNSKDNKKRRSNVKSHNTNDNFNEYFDERNNNLMSPICTPNNSKKNNYYINSLAQNRFSLELNSDFKIGLSKLKKILADKFTIYKEYNKINNKKNDNRRDKFNDDNFQFTKQKFSIISDKNKLTKFYREKTHNFKIIGNKKNNKNYRNNDIDLNNNKLHFRDDDELVSYIKKTFQKIKDMDYNNEAIKYNYFTLSRRFRGKNLYEIGLENNIEKVNNILSKEKVEIGHEPVIFITKKEFIKLKNNKTDNNINNISNTNNNNNNEELEKYKRIISTLNFDNERTEQKYKTLEEEYKKLVKLKTTTDSGKQIYDLSEENEKLKKDREKMTKYILDLQEYDKKLVEHYENKIQELIQQFQNQSINNACTFNKKNNPFAVVNSKIDNNKKDYNRESSNMNNNCEPSDQFSFKEKNTINNNENSNENDANKAMSRIKKAKELYGPGSEKSKNGKSDRITGMAKLLEMKLKPGLMNSNLNNNNTNDSNKIDNSAESVENLIEQKPVMQRSNKKIKKISFDSDE